MRENSNDSRWLICTLQIAYIFGRVCRPHSRDTCVLLWFARACNSSGILRAPSTEPHRTFCQGVPRLWFQVPQQLPVQLSLGSALAAPRSGLEFPACSARVSVSSFCRFRAFAEASSCPTSGPPFRGWSRGGVGGGLATPLASSTVMSGAFPSYPESERL